MKIKSLPFGSTYERKFKIGDIVRCNTYETTTEWSNHQEFISWEHQHKVISKFKTCFNQYNKFKSNYNETYDGYAMILNVMGETATIHKMSDKFILEDVSDKFDYDYFNIYNMSLIASNPIHSPLSNEYNDCEQNPPDYVYDYDSYCEQNPPKEFDKKKK